MKWILALNIFFSFESSFAQQNWSDKLTSRNIKNVHTDVVVISQDSKIIFQDYQNEYDFRKPHLSWSMAKTISGILVAIACQEYGFSMNDSVQKFIPDFKGSARLIDLMQMSSGIDFTEDYYGLPISSDVVKMLYLDGADRGASEYVKNLNLRKNNQPGDHFYYSSGDTNLLMEVLARIISNKEKYLNYPWSHFFDLLEIKSATIETSKNGFFIGSSYIYLSPEDYLKVGELIVNKGFWNKKRIIPADYFKLMNQVAPGVQKEAIEGSSTSRAYGSQVTTNLPISDRHMNSEYGDLPQDSLLMIGHQGQLLIASPSQKLVILRLAMDKGSSLDRKQWFQYINEFLNSQSIHLDLAKTHDVFKESESNMKPTGDVPNKLKFSDLFKLPRLIRRYTAKEFCSCYFVVKRSKEACSRDIAVSMPVLPEIKIDENQIKTQFFIGDQDRALYLGQKQGCQIN